MGTVLTTTLIKLYPMWLESCDSPILFLVPHNKRYYDGRDSVYVTLTLAFFVSVLIFAALMAIVLLTSRIVNIFRNHF